jgi:Ca2+:H+ antiporter
MAKRNSIGTGPCFWQEWPLLLSVGTAVFFYFWKDALFAHLAVPLTFALLAIWLFGTVLLAAFAVVRHADSLAVKLGEPYGTLVLTLSVISIEVMVIAAAMTAENGAGAPIARDAMFAVIMIVLNGMIGLTLLIGGLRYHEQSYNLQGASAYLAMIVSLSGLGLILPNFTRATAAPTFSPWQAIFLSVMSIGVYGVFLAIQTSRHRTYFMAPEETEEVAGDSHHNIATRSMAYHGCFLIAYLLPMVLLSKNLAVPIEYGTSVLRAPQALAGFIVAALVLFPESLSAFRAAQANQLQRSVNLLLGSVLATIGLTIPAVLIIGLITGQNVVLGLAPPQVVLLVLTLVVSIVTFTSSRTNVLLGAVHLLLFLAYFMLIFD